MRTIKIIISLLILPILLYSQTFVLDKNNSKLEVKGTSTIHDWTSNVEDFKVKASFNANEISAVSFTASVTSIKSEHNGMDKNTYEALKSDQYPEIKFTAKELTVVNGVITGQGQLTIAGKTNTVKVNLKMSKTDKISISGLIDLKMTDYGIDPPVAVFGTIKTGNEIKIAINISLIETTI